MTRSFRRRPKIIFLAFLILTAVAAQDAREIFQQIDHSVSELTRISGLALKKKVPYDLISRDKVSAFLEERVKEAVKPDELRAEELTLKKFGFVPQDFDLKKATVDLYTEQAAAFYDFHKKRLFLTDWAPSSMQEMALIHELAHALADQHFHLERFLKQAGNSDDSSLARMAVMEGQATWLMTEALARKMGQSLSSNPGLLEAMNSATETGAGQFPVFNTVPLYLRETLVFPYSGGARFQQALYAKLGVQAFTEIFRHPPVSTQQILHPEKYFARVAPADPPLPELTVHRGYKTFAEGKLGELDHSILMRQFGTQDQAGEITPHWKGGRYALLENAAEKRVILAYSSEWDSEAMAASYFAFYRQALKKKWKKIEPDGSTQNEFRGMGDDGYFLVRRDGARVTSLEGMAQPDQAKVATLR